MIKLNAVSGRLTGLVLGSALVLSGMGLAGAARADDQIRLLWGQAMREHPVHRLMQGGFLEKCKELG